MKLLLLSNSTNYAEPYMAWCAKLVSEFVGEARSNILFVPYAAAGFSYEQYTSRVNQALSPYGIEAKDLSKAEDPKAAIREASAIFVGGGNSFQLLKCLQEKELISAIREQVEHGVPYAGWSAGSNVAGQSIRTTNDMPIVEPQGFDALGLIPYQINPHFTNRTIPNHGGETRTQRLEEFLAMNPESKVICLPEGSYLSLEDGAMHYKGKEGGQLMDSLAVRDLSPGQSIVI